MIIWNPFLSFLSVSNSCFNGFHAKSNVRNFLVFSDSPNANENDNEDYGELSDTGSDSNGSFTSEEEGLIFLELDQPENDEDDDLMEIDNQQLPSTSGELHLH